MAKQFTVLQGNQKLMARLGIYSYHLSEPTNHFFKSYGTYYILFSLPVTMIIPSLVFTYINRTVNLNLAIEATFLAVAGIQAFGMFINTGLNMKRIKLLHLKLQTIVDQGIYVVNYAISYIVFSMTSLLFLFQPPKERCLKYSGKLNKSVESSRIG